MRKNHGYIGVCEGLVVPACTLPAMFVPFRQMTKLRAQYACLDGIESAVVPLDVVEVFLRLPVISEHLTAPRQSLIVCGDGSRFAAGAQILPRIKAEGGRAAHRAGLAPAVLLSGEIFCAVRLAGVFDDDEVVLGRQVED